MLWSDIPQMDARAIAVMVAFVALPPLAMLWQARRNVRGDLVGDWSSSHFVVVPDEHRDAVSHHVRRLVWARGIGAAVGWAAGFLVPIPGGPLGGVLCGYLLSTVLAEVTAQRTLGRGVAALAPRRLEAYVPSATVVGARALVALVLLLGAIPFFVATHPHRADTDRIRWTIVALAVGVAVFGLLGEALSRWVVARRQTAGSPELLAVDDALRSTSAHLLMASVLGAELLGASWVAGGSATIVALPFLVWTLLVAAIALFIAAVCALHLLAPRPWRVRRSIAATV